MHAVYEPGACAAVCRLARPLMNVIANREKHGEASAAGNECDAAGTPGGAFYAGHGRPAGRTEHGLGKWWNALSSSRIWAPAES